MRRSVSRYPTASTDSMPILFVEHCDSPDVACDPELEAGMHVKARPPADSRTRRGAEGTELSWLVDVAEGFSVRDFFPPDEDPCVLPVSQENSLDYL